VGWPLIYGSYRLGEKESSRELWPFLYRSGLSIRNGVLLYKQLMRPMMEYACPFWRSAARSHTRKRQFLQSNCLCIATTAPWYTCNGQILDDLGVSSLPTTADLSDFWLSWCGEPLSYAARQISTLTERWAVPLEWDRYRQLVLVIRKWRPLRHIESFPTGTFRQSFSVLFSRLRVMPGHNTETGHGLFPRKAAKFHRVLV
jgi:hypothetical protein